MNRRTVVAGAAALAASAVVPIGLAGAARPSLPTPEAVEFARTVMELPAERQRALAASIRLALSDPIAQRLADVIDELAGQAGWVRGEQHHQLLQVASSK